VRVLFFFFFFVPDGYRESGIKAAPRKISPVGAGSRVSIKQIDQLRRIRLSLSLPRLLDVFLASRGPGFANPAPGMMERFIEIAWFWRPLGWLSQPWRSLIVGDPGVGHSGRTRITFESCNAVRLATYQLAIFDLAVRRH